MTEPTKRPDIAGEIKAALPWFAIPVAVVAILRLTLFGAFWIPSSSMEPTLDVGDRVLVVRHLDPRPGDIVVFRDPGGWLGQSGGDLIKRVIAVGGQHVACEGGGAPVTVDGVALDEPYLEAGAQPSATAFDLTVPDGSIWVMGDNRAVSADSRYHGAVPLGDVVGVAKAVYWTPTHVRILTNGR